MRSSCNYRPVVLGALFGLSTLTVFAQAATYDDDVKALGGQDYEARKASYEHLQQGGRNAITALVNGIEGSSSERKPKLLDTLRSVKTSNKGLTAKDSDTKALARLAREEKDRSLRYKMIDALRVVGESSAVAELERFASEDPEEKIRAEATHFVATVSGKDIQFFWKQYKDPSRLVRHYAAFELARLGEKSVRGFSLQTLKESNVSDERRLAISTLGEIGALDDAVLLKQLSKSSAERYGDRVLAAHAAMTVELLQLSESGRLSFLIKSLDDPDMMVRDWAYTRLWNFPDPMTKVRLKAYLAESGHKGYKEASDALSLR